MAPELEKEWFRAEANGRVVGDLYKSILWQGAS